MKPTAEDFTTRNKTSNEHRRRYLEAKIQQKDQQSAVAVQDCERIINFLHRCEFARLGNKLLDLGCGTGRLTIELATRGYAAYGTDINPDFIEIARDKARKRGVSNTHFTTAPAEQLPFDDSFFDICIVVSVLEHVADWRKTINEVARILKPGGIAYFQTTNALYPLSGEVKYVPFIGYIPYSIRRQIIDFITTRFPAFVGYSLTPAQYWFTNTGLRKALSVAGFKQSWDIFDLINIQEVPPRFRFVRWLLPLIKKLPHPYIRYIAHFLSPGVTLLCQKD